MAFIDASTNPAFNLGCPPVSDPPDPPPGRRERLGVAVTNTRKTGGVRGGGGVRGVRERGRVKGGGEKVRQRRG